MRGTLGVLLVLATVAAYLPALTAGFIWDDDAHVTANETLRSGEGLRRIWVTPTSIPQYYPLVHTAFWIEYRLWGERPFGYHLVNVALHAANALLLYAALRRLRVPGAMLAAALFALHPVHVESVAWVTELKNVLSTFFYLAAGLVLLRCFGIGPERERPESNARLYVLGCALFVCALLSKTVTASLPAALALVLIWKRGRVTARQVAFLAPMLALGAAFGAVTVWLERHHVGAEGAAWSFDALQRILIAGRALWFYAGKLVWPAHLSFIYPRWTIDAGEWLAWVFPVAALGVLAAAWAARQRLGLGPLVAALFFGGTLFPALGFFDVYPMRYALVADHFQYTASIGLLALLAAAISMLPARRTVLLGSLAVLACLGVLTCRQARSYRDLETLWRFTLEQNPAAPMAHNNLGLILDRRNENDAAIEHYRQALASDPEFVEAQYNLANVLLEQGRTSDALSAYRRAIAIQPDNARALYNYGIALLRLSRTDEALPPLEAAVKARPDFAEARGAFAFALAQKGRAEEAREQAEAALKIDPTLIATRRDLADALVRLSRFEEALAQFRLILERDPGDLKARFNAASALLKLGRTPEAVTELDEVLRRDPGFDAARRLRAKALGQSGGADAR